MCLPRWKLALHQQRRKHQPNKSTTAGYLILTCNSNQQQQQQCRGWQTFGIQELDDEIVLEDVHLLDCRDGVDPYSLERALQPLVVRSARLVDSLLLPINPELKFLLSLASQPQMNTEAKTGESSQSVTPTCAWCPCRRCGRRRPSS